MFNYINFETGRRKFISYFVIALMYIQLTACQYYKVATYSQPIAFDMQPTTWHGIQKKNEIQKEKLSSKIFNEDKKLIVHMGTNDTYEIQSITMGDSSVAGKLSSSGLVFYNSSKNTGRVIKRTSKDILKEVHIYLFQHVNPSSVTLGEDFKIPLDDISEIRVLQSAPGKSIMVPIYTIMGSIAFVGVVYALDEEVGGVR